MAFTVYRHSRLNAVIVVWMHPSNGLFFSACILLLAVQHHMRSWLQGENSSLCRRSGDGGRLVLCHTASQAEYETRVPRPRLRQVGWRRVERGKLITVMYVVTAPLLPDTQIGVKPSKHHGI